jgi:hypothetical protein
MRLGITVIGGLLIVNGVIELGGRNTPPERRASLCAVFERSTGMTQDPPTSMLFTGQPLPLLALRAQAGLRSESASRGGCTDLTGPGPLR